MCGGRDVPQNRSRLVRFRDTRSFISCSPLSGMDLSIQVVSKAASPARSCGVGNVDRAAWADLVARKNIKFSYYFWKFGSSSKPTPGNLARMDRWRRRRFTLVWAGHQQALMYWSEKSGGRELVYLIGKNDALTVQALPPAVLDVVAAEERVKLQMDLEAYDIAMRTSKHLRCPRRI